MKQGKPKKSTKIKAGMVNVPKQDHLYLEKEMQKSGGIQL